MSPSIGSACIVAGALEEAGIPFTPAVGAIFLWADFRSFLEEATWEVGKKFTLLPVFRQLCSHHAVWMRRTLLDAPHYMHP